jgi:hypothetical protein
VEAEDDKNIKIFMVKWDVKDGFWQMCSKAGEEWYFTYVLPQLEGEPTQLVVPMSLQMGWVKSPPYFSAAFETARVITMDYGNTQTGLLQEHKFTHYTRGDKKASRLPPTSESATQLLQYGLGVYVDEFMSIVIPTS